MLTVMTFPPDHGQKSLRTQDVPSKTYRRSLVSEKTVTPGSGARKIQASPFHWAISLSWPDQSPVPVGETM